MIKIEYLKYIEMIKNRASNKGYYRNKNVYIVGDYLVNLYIEDEEYLDGLQYTKTGDLTWVWSTPREFCNKFIGKELNFTIHSFRKYGQPKLSKPNELKGIKQSLSVDYLRKKCKCQVFIKDDNVWIKHGDYFSPSAAIEDGDKGLSYICNKYLDKDKKEKFIYGDAWGDIVLKQEAWILLENLVHEIKVNNSDLDILNKIIRQQEEFHKFKKYELCSSDMERFFEKVIKGVRELILTSKT